MSQSFVCMKTKEGLRPIEDLSWLALIKCDLLESCDGGPEIKVPADVKYAEAFQIISECRESEKKKLENEAKFFNGWNFWGPRF